MRPMLVALLQNLQETLRFHVPGKVMQNSTLHASPDGTISFMFKGAKMIEALDRVFADDALMRQAVTKGSKGMGQEDPFPFSFQG